MTNPHPSRIILSGTAHPAFAAALAQQLGWPLGTVDVARFSDRETHVVIADDLAEHDVYIVQPTSEPANDHLIELLMIAHAARSMNPKRITAVMPFFGYRRQEKTMQRGEALAFELVAQLLRAAGVDRVAVMDLHKQRSAKFFDAAGLAYTELRAFELICLHFQQLHIPNAVVLAPDKGSIPESERYATALGVPLLNAYKHRATRDQVVFDELQGEVRGKQILIIDDEINTAGTLVGLVDLLKQQQSGDIYFACTHAVLSGPAIERLTTSSLKEIIVTDTIALPPEKKIEKIRSLSVIPLFVNMLQGWTE